MNRSSMDIVIDILKSVESEGVILKTHLLYRANLNSKSLEKFLRKLLSSGLISMHEDGSRRKYYKISVRGRYILRRLVLIRKMLNNRSKVFNELIKELKRGEDKYNVRLIEGARISGSSGIIHSYSLALTKGRGDGTVTTVEIIDEYLEIDDAIERVSWAWLTALDTNTQSVIVIPNKLYNQTLRFIENICRTTKHICKHKPILVPYDITNTSESIANLCTKVT